jgi:hypothetical protein
MRFFYFDETKCGEKTGARINGAAVCGSYLPEFQ